MSRCRFTVSTIALASTAALSVAIAPGASSATAAAARRCAVEGRHIRGISRSHFLGVKPRVIVFRAFGTERDTIWACGRSTNRFVALGPDESRQQADSEYAPEHVLRAIHVAGRWVLAIRETGGEFSSSCSKYQAWPCPGIEVGLVLVNAARGRPLVVTKIESYATDPHGNAVGAVLRRQLLSSQGGVVWVETSIPGAAPSHSALFGCAALVIRSRLSCVPRAIAEDGVIPGSVRLTGLDVTWSDHEGSHTAALTQ
jgi:hypothetical protein